MVGNLLPLAEARVRRLDWQLVRPEGEERLETPMQLLQTIRRLATQEAAGRLPPEDQPLLIATEDAYLQSTLAPCDAVEAPLVEDDPDCESRLLDEFAQSDTELDLETFLDIRRREPDCDRCPFVSPYGVYPMDPCEFSAGALKEILTDATLIGRVSQPMTPPEMRALAEDIEFALSQGQWRAIDEVDATDYLDKAVLFLRFWADQGFGVLPTDIDEVMALGPESPEGEGAPPTFH